VSKYGKGKMAAMNITALGLEPKVQEELLSLAGHSLAQRTWASYRSAESMLLRYCKANGKKIELPVGHSTVVGFVHWLIYKKGLKGATVSNYLAGIRMMHIVKGLDAPTLRSDFVQLVLTGKKNQDAADRLRGNTNPERQPVTPDILRLLKARLRESPHDKKDKIIFWTIFTLLFHGAFRGGELLCKNTTAFDPAFTLLKEDIRLCESSEQRKCIQVKIKMPKEDRDGRATILEVYETKSDICPISAFSKWEKVTARWEPRQPAFRAASGQPLTAARVNAVLKECLAGYIPHKIRVHSFRSGAASAMASLGLSDEDIKAIGRWSSRAYEDYIKLPRVKRGKVARSIADKY